MNKSILAISAAIVMSIASMSVFAYDVSGSGYAMNSVRQIGTAVPGTVIEVRKINIGPSDTALMASRTVGAVAGGAIGASATGNNAFLKVAAGALSGVAGGFIGDKAAEMIGGQEGLEITVESKGNVFVVTQSISDGAQFSIGDAVWVVNSGGASRITRRSTPSVQ